MSKKRFYYNRSVVYGWCVYDRETNTPAYEACGELLPAVKKDESGTVTVSPICESEYKAMSLCTKLNIAWKRVSAQ
jgi:hypothetical protein